MNQKQGIGGVLSRATGNVQELAAEVMEGASESAHRAYGGATGEAADALASVAGSVTAVGDTAHSTGKAIRRGTKRAARSIDRGGKKVRKSDPDEILEAAAASVQRHRFTLAVAGAAVLTYATVSFLWRKYGRA